MDIKDFRENELKLSREEFSTRFSISIEDLIEWEDGIPSFDTLPYIIEIAKKTDLNLNDIIRYKKPERKAFMPRDNWEKADFTKRRLLDYISEKLDSVDVSNELKEKYLVDLGEIINRTLNKPKMCVVGRSDTGKSTLINALLGRDKMPVSWTPTTSIAIYIKHVKDRPEFISDEVWIFKEQNEDEKMWDSGRLYDEEYCNTWKIASGSIDILRDFGTRQGIQSMNGGSAVVFVDAPLLLDCDIIDLPGYGTDLESDNTTTLMVVNRSDIMIYLSRANGFMVDDEDAVFLRENLRGMPVWEKKGENKQKILSNVFVVASQAYTVDHGNEKELEIILKAGCQRFLGNLSDGYWSNREEQSGYKIGMFDVLKRFFTFSTEIPALCERFEKALKNTVENLPVIIEAKAKQLIKQYVDDQIPRLAKEIETFEEILNNREKYVHLLNEMTPERELERKRKESERKETVRTKIEKLEDDSIVKFDDFYLKTINSDALRDRIVDEKVEKNEESIKQFASRIHDELLVKCGEIQKECSEELKKDIDEYLKGYKDEIKKQFDEFDIPMDFDVDFTFAKILAGIGIVGGLGAFLVTNAVLALAAAGTLSISATATAAFASSTFLGPIGIGIGVLILISLGAFRLFTGGWQMRLAKQIVTSFDEHKIDEETGVAQKNVPEKYRDALREYWEKTWRAFDEATTKVERKWNEYIDEIKKTVNDTDPESVNKKIDELKDIEAFFASIPL